MKSTAIEWCDHTWSPWRGCTKVSPGCANCYAEKLSKRNPSVLGHWGKGKPRVLAKNWRDPVKWNEDSHEGVAEGILLDKYIGNRRVFPSLCDWLDEEVPIEWLGRFLVLIHHTPYLDWLLLTKRPEMWAQRMVKARNYLTAVGCVETANFIHEWLPMAKMPGIAERSGTPPRNVWVGTSVEDERHADERIPKLLKIPTRLRFLSVEPLIGPLDDISWAFPQRHPVLRATMVTNPDIGVEWVIIGGESGPKSRPCNVEWLRSIVKQCADAKVPCFVKQLGSRPFEPLRAENVPSRMIDSEHDITDLDVELFDQMCRSMILPITHPKGGDPAEWPTDLRIREFPEVKP